MRQYDRRIVTAPDWMTNFHCIAGSCPETCCQQWNIDVDPAHADFYTHLGDPELQPVIDSLLRTFRIRRAGNQGSGTCYRLQLMNQPDGRCPLLDNSGKCRLQKKYGAEALCDTCYFHPRTFFQIDEEICLSACLSCPECARLALLHREPAAFTRFETEIDPNLEWLETSLIDVPDAQMLMRNRNLIVEKLISFLQDRQDPFTDRMDKAIRFLEILSAFPHPDQDSIRKSAENCKTAPGHGEGIPKDSREIIQIYLEVFDPVNPALEKPTQSVSALTRALTVQSGSFAELLSKSYAQAEEITAPFLSENGHLIENFMVNCVFSDSFKQFYRCQNEPVTAEEILQHESALLRVWYVMLRVLLARTALAGRTMNTDLFLRTVIHADRDFWHYPDWFSRIAERENNRQKTAVSGQKRSAC
ncbi:MAG: flagellin lysine-N-methylase [Anaerolineaceae bacterium]|nr:flagellin lysine-N-methylase [Anaerolineaceae bacterium]